MSDNSKKVEQVLNEFPDPETGRSVIVVDNGSSDDTPVKLAQSRPLKIESRSNWV